MALNYDNLILNDRANFIKIIKYLVNMNDLPCFNFDNKMCLFRIMLDIISANMDTHMKQPDFSKFVLTVYNKIHEVEYQSGSKEQYKIVKDVISTLKSKLTTFIINNLDTNYDEYSKTILTFIDNFDNKYVSKLFDDYNKNKNDNKNNNNVNLVIKENKKNNKNNKNNKNIIENNDGKVARYRTTGSLRKLKPVDYKKFF